MTDPKPSASPSTSPGAYSPEQAARDAAVNKTGTPLTGYALLNYGTGIPMGPVTTTKSKDLVVGNYTFQFDTTQGYITAVDNTNTANTIPNTAFLADPKNNSSIQLNPANGNTMTADEAANQWLMENNNSEKVNDLRNLLIAKGWLTGTAAKYSMQFGTIGDASLAKALAGAITEISWRNVALMKTGSDPLTLEKGLANLTKASEPYDPYADGTTTNIQRQEFKPEDYRQAVDEQFMKARGRGATDDELNIFIKTLQSMEAKNPQITTTTRSGGTTTTSTKGGVSDAAAGDVLNKQIIKDPETADFQAATTYMDWFNQALDAGVNLND